MQQRGSLSSAVVSGFGLYEWPAYLSVALDGLSAGTTVGYEAVKVLFKSV